MGVDLRLRPAARLDLLAVWEYVAIESSPDRADGVLDALGDAFDRIGQYPRIGRARPEVAAGLRSYVAGSYVIFYVALPDTVEVVRVARAERDTGLLFPEIDGD